MTPAFSPNGLLSHGLHDKEERSARVKESHARQHGDKLIDVPTKVSAPQNGLVGAISAHQKDHNKAGGYGATLMERERERKKNEKEGDLQRQQFEMMQQQQQQQMYGGMMGGYGMNPMMGGNGMNPMMGYGMMNPYGYGMVDPRQQQAMMAAQQAYFQSMIHMSTPQATPPETPTHLPQPSQSGNPLSRAHSPQPSLSMNFSAPPPQMGGHSPQMSMYGMGMMNPYGMMAPQNPYAMYGGMQGGYGMMGQGSQLGMSGGMEGNPHERKGEE